VVPSGGWVLLSNKAGVTGAAGRAIKSVTRRRRAWRPSLKGEDGVMSVLQSQEGTVSGCGTVSFDAVSPSE